MRLGFLENTTRLAVTDAAAEYELSGAVDEGRYAVALSSDVVIHVERNNTATTDSMRIPANELVMLRMWGVDTLSFLNDGTDGNVWISRFLDA